MSENIHPALLENLLDLPELPEDDSCPIPHRFSCYFENKNLICAIQDAYIDGLIKGLEVVKSRLVEYLTFLVIPSSNELGFRDSPIIALDQVIKALFVDFTPIPQALNLEEYVRKLYDIADVPCRVQQTAEILAARIDCIIQKLVSIRRTKQRTKKSKLQTRSRALLTISDMNTEVFPETQYSLQPINGQTIPKDNPLSEVAATLKDATGFVFTTLLPFINKVRCNAQQLVVQTADAFCIEPVATAVEELVKQYNEQVPIDELIDTVTFPILSFLDFMGTQFSIISGSDQPQSLTNQENINTGDISINSYIPLMIKIARDSYFACQKMNACDSFGNPLCQPCDPPSCLEPSSTCNPADLTCPGVVYGINDFGAPEPIFCPDGCNPNVSFLDCCQLLFTPIDLIPK